MSYRLPSCPGVNGTFGSKRMLLPATLDKVLHLAHSTSAAVTAGGSGDMLMSHRQGSIAREVGCSQCGPGPGGRAR